MNNMYILMLLFSRETTGSKETPISIKSGLRGSSLLNIMLKTPTPPWKRAIMFGEEE